MPKMKIVTDAMLDRANKIGQNTSNILEKQNMVTDLFKNMGRSFSGKIPSLMTQHMLAMDKEYQTMNGILTNYKNFLEDAAHNYEWKEEELARMAESLGGTGRNSGTTSGSTGVTTGSSTTGTTGTSNPTNNPTNNSGYEEVINTPPTGGWDASGGWDTVGDSFPNQRPDLDSIYYRGDNPEIIQRSYYKYDTDHPGHIDCCFYARSRAMERNGWTQTYGTFTSVQDPELLKVGDRVVRFDRPGGGNHFVYVETYDASTDTVYFSDANMTSHPDGLLQSMSFDDFKHF